MAEAPVLVERSGGIVTLTLNKPDIRNAMTADLTDAFTAAIDDLRGDADARVLIVTGAGKAFCAGGDLSFIQPGPGASVPDIRAKMRAFYGKFLAVRDLEIPTIAAINGSAVGAGLCLAMACDLRIAAADAKLTAAFTKLGLHPGMAGTYLLSKLVGSARAADLLFTSRVIDAGEAEAMGLVNRAVPGASLMDEARALAGEIAANAPIATRLVKRAIKLAEKNDLETMLEYEALAQAVTMASADLLEGLAAVKEKRAPKFEGK